MHLKYCSITGADDDVYIHDLADIASRYPFAEWAILLLPALSGKPRCPSDGWIRKFKKEYKGPHAALHLCDEAFLDFAAGKPGVLDMMTGFGRVQLNFRFGDVDGKYDMAEVAARVKENPAHEFILQYTEDMKGVPALFADIPNHSILFDASAGSGISPARWPALIEGHFCGYAGGISPENINQNLKSIARVASGQETWIDMESGVRTEDEFDLGKVKRVLEAAKVYAA